MTDEADSWGKSASSAKPVQSAFYLLRIVTFLVLMAESGNSNPQQHDDQRKLALLSDGAAWYGGWQEGQRFGRELACLPKLIYDQASVNTDTNMAVVRVTRTVTVTASNRSGETLIFNYAAYSAKNKKSAQWQGKSTLQRTKRN